MKQALLYYYAFLVGSVVFSITLQILLPDGIGFIVTLAFFIAFPFLIRILVKRLRTGGTSSFFSTGSLYSRPQKICLVCGKKSNGKIQCGRCGSRQFKIT